MLSKSIYYVVCMSYSVSACSTLVCSVVRCVYVLLSICAYLQLYVYTMPYMYACNLCGVIVCFVVVVCLCVYIRNVKQWTEWMNERNERQLRNQPLTFVRCEPVICCELRAAKAKSDCFVYINSKCVFAVRHAAVQAAYENCTNRRCGHSIHRSAVFCLRIIWHAASQCQHYFTRVSLFCCENIPMNQMKLAANRSLFQSFFSTVFDFKKFV